MKPSAKAALFSALLFPGLGQALVLKRPRRAMLFMIATAVALIWLLGAAFTTASAIADQVVAGTLPLDPQAIASQIESGNPGGAAGNIAAGVLLAAWIGSIADALFSRR